MSAQNVTDQLSAGRILAELAHQALAWQHRLGVSFRPDQGDLGVYLDGDHLGTVAILGGRRVYVVALGQGRVTALPPGELPEDPIALADVERWRTQQAEEVGQLPEEIGDYTLARIRAAADLQRRLSRAAHAKDLPEPVLLVDEMALYAPESSEALGSDQVNCRSAEQN
ncbi:hypothetical protein [Kitasatospora kifunensis]|uniref:Uncharacterized protein n=1 Tax=Kitasatospora kifunensis TaxID=58351 RepID=A0A7W7W0W9_KITKI|nr:hypothetical protein [Kitasatospora kifunensis]MBB4929085.1 hypothetical protein [Kitasatospora kifunensis]